MTIGEIGSIGLLLIILVNQFRVIRTIVNYREEETSILREKDRTKFLFPSNDWTDKIAPNILLIYFLSAQPYDNLIIPCLVPIAILIINTLIAVVFRNSEIMTLDTSTMTFRFGTNRSLEEIQCVNFEEKWIVLQAKNHPKETRFYKNSFKGDWNALCLALFEFVSRNPEIEITGDISKASYTSKS